MSRTSKADPAPCNHCGVSPTEHQGEHAGLCCDCFDLSCGMPLRQINAERKEQGLPPVKSWSKAGKPAARKRGRR